MARRAFQLIDRFEGVVSARVTSPSGTDVRLNLKERAFDTDVDVAPGHTGNLPAGEIWCAPMEDGADGVIVVDGSIGDLGNVTSPLRLVVQGGASSPWKPRTSSCWPGSRSCWAWTTRHA